MATEINDMVSHFMEQVKLQDLINVGFMKPVELALRTHKNDKEVPNDSLPQGLLYAHKEQGFSANKYTLHPVQEVNKEANLHEIRENHQDNYISLLKKPKGTELAICVCMYSEDKPMLKRTLEGIADNIDLLIEKGTSPDEIYVAIIIDGIQKVDPSLFTYFQQFERESQIYVEEDDENSMRKKYQNRMVDTELGGYDNLNYSKFLFQEDEFNDRLQRKFIRVREQYDNVCRLRTQIQNIKKQRNSANQNLKMILSKIIDQQKNALRAMIEEDQDGIINQDDFNITEESIMKQLVSSQEECNQYVAARDELAYFSAYRLPTRSLSQTIVEREKQQEQRREARNTDDSQGALRGSLLGTERQSKEGQAEQHSRRQSKYVNLIFCIKYKNSGKLSSHNWFFNGICNQLKPKYSILLDVGLRPYPDALYKMYHYMRRRPHIGGVCGYMSLKAEKVEDQQMHKEEDLDWLSSFCLNFFDIQKAQQIEYHFAHLIDKPFESIFKFIHVLPGAFSGYSMDALRPVDRRDALLRQYFKSIDDKLKSNKVVPSTFTASDMLMRIFLPKVIWKHIRPVDPDSEEQVLYNENIYLAEDRILCMGIHKNEKDIIFMPDAYAEVDPIKTVNGLMGQRKRWINGSNFAFEKVQKEMDRNQSEKMWWADVFLKMQIFYLNFSNLLVYFAPAILLFTFHLTMSTIKEQYLADVFQINDPNGVGSIVFSTFVNIMDFLYAVMFFGVVFLSIHLTHNNKRFIYYIYFFSTIFGLFAVITFIVILVDIANGFAKNDNYIENQYAKLLENALPGTGVFVDLLRYFILGSMLFYIFPLAIYGIFFMRIKYFWQIITGTFSFLFYSPAYLNLLNVYALCRIDDISWGTKGLDAEVGGKNAKLKDTWKIVKMIDVAKFFLWNVVLGTLFIVFDSYLIIKFFVTLILLMLFTFIQVIKIIIGMCYIIKYKCITAKKNKADRETPLAHIKDPNGENPNDGQQECLEPKEMNFHIYSVIDAFEQQLRNDIEFAFQFAASADTEQQYVEVKPDMKYASLVKGQATLDPRTSRVSKQVMHAFQSNKFQNIRKVNEMKKDYYPDMKKPAAKLNDNEGANIEVHLLQRKFQTDVAKKVQANGGRGTVNMDKIRQTFMNNIQSKRFG